MPENTNTKLIAGLGNPGPSNADNRHNAGFMALSLFSAKQRLTSGTSIGNCTIIQGEILGIPVILAWPLSYMENSGNAIKEAMDHFLLKDPQDILILHDSIGLPPGSLEIGKGGEPGGHDGLISVDSALGTGYARIGIGIGYPVPGDDGATPSPKDYALSPFDFDELDIVRPSLALAADAAFAWLTKGFDSAQALLSEQS
ncbi:MAG: aminoacyl-tRNA hydrolase [Deltaproteobacteria bacterium]|jgi:PTH1 family peptidyl-tRNA hydrolase|nr:aminoacyl-tRNA hydrolase [Deltaproteobacteria bacterium]